MGTILQVLRADSQFSTVTALVESGGLAKALSGPGPLTMLAPTDAAFAKLSATDLERLNASRSSTRVLLLEHILTSRFRSDQLDQLEACDVASGDALPVRTTAEGVFVCDARVVASDVEADNGLVHAVDRVLAPVLVVASG